MDLSRRSLSGCATRRICGSAKGHGFICVAKGHGFICVAKGHGFICVAKGHGFICVAKGHGFICVAKGHGFICVAKGHDFSRAVKRSQFDTFGASAPEASAAKAGERQIIMRRCGTTKVVPFRKSRPDLRGAHPFCLAWTRHPRYKITPSGQQAPHVALRFSGAKDAGLKPSATR